MTDINVQYERKYSDGNYGSEGLSMSVTIGEVVTDEEALDIAHRLRRTVLSFLAASEARNVAHAAQRELNPPSPRQAVAAGADPLEDMPF